MGTWTSSLETKELFEGFFKPILTNTAGSKFSYNTPHDFGKEIHELLFCQPKKGFTSRSSKNIREIGEIEGFTITTCQETSFPRDPILVKDNSKVLITYYLPSHTKVTEKLGNRVHVWKGHPAVLTDSLFCGWLFRTGRIRAASHQCIEHCKIHYHKRKQTLYRMWQFFAHKQQIQHTSMADRRRLSHCNTAIFTL